MGYLSNALRFPVEILDAFDQPAIENVARKYKIDMILTTATPASNVPIFEAAFNVGANYMDTAASVSKPHPTEPYKQCNEKVGDYQFARDHLWRRKGILALLAMGVEPGMSDVFARYAYEHLFDEMEEVGIRDGSDFTTPGHEFAFNFNIWTCLEECLNPPVFWEKEKGFYTQEPLSAAEVFEFPEGLGKIEVVSVEHEEVQKINTQINSSRCA